MKLSVFVFAGVLLAGCSTIGSGPASSGASPVQNANGVRADRALADGLAHAAGTASESNGWLAPDAKKHKNLIYWGNYYDSSIAIFSSKGKDEGEITSGLSNPERLFVDAQRNVYATNIGSDTITGYEPGQTSPFLSISDGVDRPTGLTVDGGGTVYCANVGNDTITEYPKGQTSPSLTISVSGAPEYLATDADDNLYASVGTEVMEFPKGSTSGKNLGLEIGAPGALEVDRSGDIIAIDESSSTIDIFPAGKTAPSKQIDVTSGDPFGLSLSGNEKELYVSVDVGTTFAVQVVAYPKGSSLSNKLTGDTGDWPLAVSPDNALGT
jgi:hypothetical protein